MDFRTVVKIPLPDFSIDHKMRQMLFGSCFSENIGKKLLENKFSVDVNPFGILYNPSSISTAIFRLMRNERFSENDLVFHNNVYQSFLHHGSFSHPDKLQCLEQINNRFDNAVGTLNKADVIFITFGTAYIYQLKSDNKVVGNCHKFPSDMFNRKRLSVQDIFDDWTKLIAKLLDKNPQLQLVFTVSPIRHFKDGAHENQLSKSTLHLAIAALKEHFGRNVHYFPAYEIVMDELRDYRFYTSDMLHPSDVAVDYLWKRFSETYFTDQTLSIMQEWAEIYRALQHRPLNGVTENYQSFLLQTKDKIARFSHKYPFISCKSEMKKLNSILENIKLS